MKPVWKVSKSKGCNLGSGWVVERAGQFFKGIWVADLADMMQEELSQEKYPERRKQMQSWK